LVIRGLCRYADNAVCAVKGESVREITFKTSQIAEVTKAVAEELEADLDLDHITARRVGRVLGKMRLKPDRDGKLKGWRVALSDLERWAASYGVPFDLSRESTPPPNGTNETNGITAQAAADREVLEL
jgi:hypothetical protein